MKSKRIHLGLEWNRINYKNCWMHIQRDEFNREFVVLMSYDTPILMLVHYEDETSVNIAINERAFKYSQTTSRQIAQFVSMMHMFVTWGGYVPFSVELREIIEHSRTENDKRFDAYYTETYNVFTYTEKTLSNMVEVLHYVTDNPQTLELWQL